MSETAKAPAAAEGASVVVAIGASPQGGDGLACDNKPNLGMSAATGKKRLARNRLTFDAVVLVGYAASANPALTGVPVHEWAGLGAFVLLAAHCAARGIWRGTAGKGRWLTMLNVLLLLALAVCCVSGVMVSGTVLPSLGLFADGYYFWDPLHAMAAKLLLALLLVHVAVHLPWIAGVLKR